MSRAQWHSGIGIHTRIVDVWDYYTTGGGTRVLVGIDEDGHLVTVPLAFVEVSA